MRLNAGSSPRLRGTVHRRRCNHELGRFIPAPAGNRIVTVTSFPLAAVHPRACGEQLTRILESAVDAGSSPRLRGTGFSSQPAHSDYRFIPAPAGNSMSTGVGSVLGPVHPRACGEQITSLSNKSRSPTRFIPAPAGNRKDPSTAPVVKYGSSPRLRGTVVDALSLMARRRFIPAPAGNSFSWFESSCCAPVHPRACGEQGPNSTKTESRYGSSPRLRGTAPRYSDSGSDSRFIPAPAGNRSPEEWCDSVLTVHPRACGEQAL